MSDFHFLSGFAAQPKSGMTMATGVAVAAVGRLPSAGASEKKTSIPMSGPCCLLATCLLQLRKSVVECGLVQCWSE